MKKVGLYVRAVIIYVGGLFNRGKERPVLHKAEPNLTSPFVVDTNFQEDSLPETYSNQGPIPEALFEKAQKNPSNLSSYWNQSKRK
ncbi:MAG: hypothetical protein AAB603_02825 [Patescibacteria group bacterium]